MSIFTITSTMTETKIAKLGGIPVVIGIAETYGDAAYIVNSYINKWNLRNGGLFTSINESHLSINEEV